MSWLGLYLEGVIDETQTHEFNSNAISTKTAALHATTHKRQRDAEAEAHATIAQERNLFVLCVLRLLRSRLQGSLGALMDSQGAHWGP